MSTVPVLSGVAVGSWKDATSPPCSHCCGGRCPRVIGTSFQYRQQPDPAARRGRLVDRTSDTADRRGSTRAARRTPDQAKATSQPATTQPSHVQRVAPDEKDGNAATR